MALRSRIQEGYTLSDSLREHPRVFDSLFCSMVAAGEKSGHLDVVLNRLADYTEQRQRLKSRLLQAMPTRWYCWWWQRAWSLFC